MDSSDVELPPPPVTNRPPLSRVPFGRVTSRKRPFAVSATVTTGVDDDDLAAAFNTSSDPAVFSSEETPDVENYSGSKRRKKKVYSGTWWGRLRSNEKMRADKSHVREKRQFRRNLDSGIFMGDESSSGPEFSSDPIEMLRGLSRDDSSFDLSSGVDTDGFEHELPPKRKESFKRAPSKITVEKSASDSRVEKVVQQCLDDCVGDVDLTNMELTSLPSTMTDLRTLVRPGSEVTYSKMGAHLRLYLGNNSFDQFPSVVLELDKLRLLSIRQNHLSIIPGAIRNLKKLEELNVSGNKLECLPFEILELMDKIHPPRLLLDPNPWTPIPPTKDLLQDVPSLYLERNLRSLRLSRVAIQPATEFGPIGIPVSSAKAVQATKHPRSPYLTELILRKLLHNHEPAKDLLSRYSDLLSDNVRSSLGTLSQCQAGNGKGRQCTFCHRDMIQPRLKWLEWWCIIDGGGKPWDDLRQRYSVSETPPAFGTKDGVDYGDDVVPRPFLREACGCVSQAEGLEEEARRLLSSCNPSTDPIEQKESDL